MVFMPTQQRTQIPGFGTKVRALVHDEKAQSDQSQTIIDQRHRMSILILPFTYEYHRFVQVRQILKSDIIAVALNQSQSPRGKVAQSTTDLTCKWVTFLDYGRLSSVGKPASTCDSPNKLDGAGFAIDPCDFGSALQKILLSNVMKL